MLTCTHLHILEDIHPTACTHPRCGFFTLQHICVFRLLFTRTAYFTRTQESRPQAQSHKHSASSLAGGPIAGLCALDPRYLLSSRLQQGRAACSVLPCSAQLAPAAPGLLLLFCSLLDCSVLLRHGWSFTQLCN